MPLQSCLFFTVLMTVSYDNAGPLPVPERWHEDIGKGVFDLEETDIGSTDQVTPPSPFHCPPGAPLTRFTPKDSHTAVDCLSAPLHSGAAVLKMSHCNLALILHLGHMGTFASHWHLVVSCSVARLWSCHLNALVNVGIRLPGPGAEARGICVGR